MHRSLWLQEVAGDAPAAPPLTGRARADVAIIGGGYVGLWAAIRIKQAQPSCDVVVLERDSLRWRRVGPQWRVRALVWPKLASLTALVGAADAVGIPRQSEDAIDEIRAFCAAPDVDADFRRGGWLWTATSAAQVGAWEGLLETCARAGVEPFRGLRQRRLDHRLRGRIGPAFDRSARRAVDVEADFRRYYPSLADVPSRTTGRGPSTARQAASR